MENVIAHGIGVTNRYALFYDEDGDTDDIFKRQQEKQKRKAEKNQNKDKGKAKPAKQDAPVAVVTPPKPKENPPLKTAKNTVTPDPPKAKGKPFAERTTKNAQPIVENKPIEEKKNFRNQEEPFGNPDFKERDAEARRGRGGFRGRGGRDRGRGYFGNNDGRNRRLFDRHSGSDKTGVRPVDKKDGAGPNNWGDIKSDINRRKMDELDAGNDKLNESMNWDTEDRDVEKTNLKAKKNDVPDVDTKENDPTVTNQVEEVVKEMTLDEWKREQEAKRAIPKYNLRKPGEGEDDKQWKQVYLLKKKDKEVQETGSDEEVEESVRKGQQQRQLLNIQINFSDSRRGRGRGRGGRGARDGGKGDASRDEQFRGRDSGKMNKGSQQSAPRVDDWNDFPSLIHA